MATLIVLDHLSSSMGRRDEAPNQELAQKIADSEDLQAVQSLIDLLTTAKKAIQADCIKVLYEIGAVKPELIAPHILVFQALLNSKNNRLQWGAMTALDAIAAVKPREIFSILTEILTAGEQGSVITRDHSVGILIKLAALPTFQGDALPLLNEQLMRSPDNQLPMYAERAFPVIPDGQKELFATTLSNRVVEIGKESKRKRIEKIIRRLRK